MPTRKSRRRWMRSGISRSTKLYDGGWREDFDEDSFRKGWPLAGPSAWTSSAPSTGHRTSAIARTVRPRKMTRKRPSQLRAAAVAPQGVRRPG